VLAILPLAAYIGRATEALADRLGGGIGGLLNATFGNAAELIIGVLALRHGLPDLVKASLTGSILGNVLLVFGAAAFAGEMRHRVQRFNRTAAGLGTTMLLLSAVGLIVPAVFHYLARGGGAPELDTESRSSCWPPIARARIYAAHAPDPLRDTGSSTPRRASGSWRDPTVGPAAPRVDGRRRDRQ
jgi:Ca2+:H+ antiporter